MRDKYLPRMRDAFDARGYVDSVADGRVFRALLSANAADRCLARVDANAEHDFGQAARHQLLIDLCDSALHTDGCGDCVERVRLASDRRAEERHQAIAQIFIERALMRE